ncbi:hypothetical protein DDZ13_08185 [Coraliomargarita sinensis]|uniref:Relaxase n=1 Tax=Coraliomargarita sinensis TaxID=2174842 RepID=A0A317ZET9_9BACT|nr:relaxase/mobilization nuclease domain-containing protein [Coraliomargarita sinensis]PXA04014.1 hypothetical protein DDZ13_08185 [Coraliomargarita sinensis]
MLIKILHQGGADSDPFVYLCEKERPVASEYNELEVKIARKLIANSPYKRAYTSGVVTIEKTTYEKFGRDHVLRSIKKRVEKFFCTGINRSDIHIVWILHTEHDRDELHFVIINTHLGTGKRFQPYWVGSDQKPLKALQELLNLRFGLASPDDPERARLECVPKRSIPARNKSIFIDTDAEICQLLRKGRLRSYNDICSHLDKKGFQVKKGKGYIGIRPKESSQKNIRLRGVKYTEGFDYQEWLEFKKNAPALYRNPEEIRKREDALTNQLNLGLERRYARMVKKYGKPHQPAKEKVNNEPRKSTKRADTRPFGSGPQTTENGPECQHQPKQSHEISRKQPARVQRDYVEHDGQLGISAFLQQIKQRLRRLAARRRRSDEDYPHHQDERLQPLPFHQKWLRSVFLFRRRDINSQDYREARDKKRSPSGTILVEPDSRITRDDQSPPTM